MIINSIKITDTQTLKPDNFITFVNYQQIFRIITIRNNSILVLNLNYCFEIAKHSKEIGRFILEKT